jgi:hypothetical protein
MPSGCTDSFGGTTKLDISLHSKERLREGLLRIVDILTHTVVGRVASGTQNAEPMTHEARTAIKKLRAFLRPIRPAVSQQFFEAEETTERGGRTISFRPRHGSCSGNDQITRQHNQSEQKSFVFGP